MQVREVWAASRLDAPIVNLSIAEPEVDEYGEVVAAMRKWRMAAVDLLTGDGKCESLFCMAAFREAEGLPADCLQAKLLLDPWRDSFFWKSSSSQGKAFAAFMWAVAVTQQRTVAVLQRTTDGHGRTVYLNPARHRCRALPSGAGRAESVRVEREREAVPRTGHRGSRDSCGVPHPCAYRGTTSSVWVSRIGLLSDCYRIR